MIMALFFQLLTEEELRNLTVEQLKKLKAVYYHTLATNPTIKRVLGEKISQALSDIEGDQSQE
jgi:hypothetical protein